MKYFTDKEVACKCKDCCGGVSAMDSLFMLLMDRLREEVGGPLWVTSAFRCKTWNRTVGGVDDSYHTLGLAMDVVCEVMTHEDVAALARKYFEEVIVYDTFVHIANPLYR